MNRSSVLLVLALLLCGGPASAYHLWLETTHTGDLMPGDTLTIEVHLDTESDVGLAYFSASVVFPDGILQYDRPASSQTSYILFSPFEGKGLPSVYMVPRDITGPGPAEWPLASDQVNVDFMSFTVTDPTRAATSDELLATLVFDVVGTGSGQISLGATRDGNTFVADPGSGLADITPSISFGAPLSIDSVLPAVPVFGAVALVLLTGTLLVAGRSNALRIHQSKISAGCALLLGMAMFFAFSPGPGGAQSGGGGAGVGDVDDDGVPDEFDNCLDVPNGPLAGTGSCNAQEDHDLDGYGAPCDTDVNNDGVTALDEILGYIVVAGSTNPAYDFNCDGAVGIDDYGDLINDIVVYDLVGPSGLSCAGTAPCVGP